MMSELPAPPLPADCDLRDFAYMPLDVVRLRDADICSIPAESFRAAVISWCVAWHQIPAASLPDDDAALCRLLGYGRDIKGWMKVRTAGALRGWIKCSDGRLYHPVVAEKAIEALTKKRAQRDRTEAARMARLSHRDEYEMSQPLSQTAEPSVTDSVTTSATSSKGIEGNRREGKEEESFATLTQRARDEFDQFWEIYPNKAKPDAARRAWKRATARASPAEIIAGAKAYPFRNEPRYQPFAAKWLDDGGWKVAGGSAAPRPNPQAKAERDAMLGRWLDKLRTHHGEAMNGTTIADLDRAVLLVPPEKFTRWLDGIEYGETWVLDAIHAPAASP